MTLMPILVGVIVLGAMIWLSASQIVRELRVDRDEAARDRALAILRTFAPGIEAARADPRALLVWHPLARAVRHLFPVECSALDAASGAPFPFTPEQVQAAHARWTTDWLAWERAHDAEYKSRAVVAEQELAASSGSPAARARLDAVEREKLDLYQRRYQDYVQIAKALQTLIAGAPSGGAASENRRPRE